ncbi:MAG: glycosyltransferase [Acidobacteria bacterium]|nr:glycosyltransferase [Acidobacteriota bacterium]MBV9477838.1 glycosyltransferase [Acidobacteriota bacterium]
MRRAEPRPLRIARIIARLNVGGPARHVVWLSEALAPAASHGEFETALITGIVPPGEEDMSAFAHAHGVAPVVIPEMSREISPRDLVTVVKLFRFFKRFRPDIIHTHTAKAGTAGRIAGWLYRWLTPGTLIGRPRRVRFVHTFHGHVFHSYYGRLKTRVFLTIEKLLARFTTDVIVTISDQQRREIHETFGVGRAEQFRVIPLGLDLTSCDVPPHQHEPLVAGIVGRLAPIKNHELFLRVAAALADASLRFVAYGDGSERVALERRARELGLGARMEFAGTRTIDEIYASIDIAALTSLNEGTPLTLIEALAAGLPAISTAVGGVVDVLGRIEERVERDGVAYEIRERGVTAASNDERGFAAGLRRLATDAALRARFSERGKAFAHATYSKDRLVADIIRLYRELRVHPRANTQE